ncbi:TBC1 domain family member 1-like [Oncorhynchus keta]|uniref:TBC1 domain family member 1-like n=1 Tax=Oncorhynchus keta TaxID=8018 RepID=UPI00227D582F|nr:TBC1 domain family member 1-like [Oncorhynchus keta]
MGSLRSLYEQKQRSHQHTDHRPVPEAPAPVEVQSSSRQRLEQFKTRAKRSLTESLEGIWKGSSKARAQRENSEGDISSSDSTLNSTEQDPSLEDPLPSSNPLRSHNSTGDLKRLDTSPLRLSFLLIPVSVLPGRTVPVAWLQAESQHLQPLPSYHDHAPSYPDHTPQYTHTPQVPSSSTKPKLVRHYSVSTDTPHQSK